LRYTTEAFTKDTEVIGNIGLHIDAEIDIDDTNWMADIVDIDPKGNRQLISSGALKAKFRALDPKKTTEQRPIHLRQEPVPIVPGEVNRYDIALTPTANLFQKGHKMELVIRNQDDMLGKAARSGLYLMPFMQTVTHTIHLKNSYITLPITN
jgi:predicted acyl esterase